MRPLSGEKMPKGGLENHRQRGGNPSQRKRRKAEKVALKRAARRVDRSERGEG